MAGDETENYQRELSDKNRLEKHSCLNHTLVKNMREQPQATKLVHSPRRPGKDVENADENSKSYIKSMKLTNSSSSSSSNISCDNRQKRKSLQILQPSVDGQKLLVGGKSARKIKKHSKQAKEVSCSKSKQSKLQLPRCSKDNDSPSSSSEVESASTRSENLSDVQTSSNEAYSLMIQDPTSEMYWELVAEERRKALEETLQENQKLYQVIEELKAENAALHEKANHTDYYATMYKIAQEFDQKPEKPKDI